MTSPFDLRLNEQLAEYNSFRVGGKAKRLFIPTDLNNLTDFLHNTTLNNTSLYWIGLGSNLLISDGLYPGTAVISRGLSQISLLTHENSVRIEAGVACGTAARFCARLGITGIEFLAGVPGTMGGALAMNAGAHGQETWEFVTHCETINSQGQITLRAAREFQPSYRQVMGLEPDKEWFVAAHLQLIPGNKEESLAKITHYLAHRAATQPINLPNCGSVFRNPPGNYAAKLIETSQLKNFSIGGARVSEKHANFIITEKFATASDIKNLIQHIQNTVKSVHGIELIREVKILETH
jgi:UDP-N-acetylmuramate dehydrogenase